MTCAIDLGPILGDSDFRPVLYGLHREPTGTALFVRWTNGRQKAQDRHADHIDVANGICSQEYGTFLDVCEAYVNDGIEPVYSSSYECWLMPREECEWVPENDYRLHHAPWRPDYFTDKNIRLREELKEQVHQPLGRMAKVWRGSEEERKDDSVRALSYGPLAKPQLLRQCDKVRLVRRRCVWQCHLAPLVRKRDVRFPFDPNRVLHGPYTNVKVSRGDIVLARGNDYSRAVVYEGKGAIYAGSDVAVIRLEGPHKWGKTESPDYREWAEYLALFLMSDLCDDLLEMVGGEGASERLRLCDLKKLPVLEPTHDLAYYREQYEFLANPQARVYQLPEGLRDAMRHPKDALDRSLVQRMELWKTWQLRRLLAGDIRELNICYRNGAYKTAVIAAGSILEAVLIDWLSEIDQRDYFKEPYVKQKANGETVSLKLGIGLRIDKIWERQQAVGSDWGRARKCARSVQAARKRVRATLSMKKGPVDKEQAGKVISDLKVVLASRGVTF